MLLPLPFAALVKLERNVALVLEVYLAGASVNVISVSGLLVVSLESQQQIRARQETSQCDADMKQLTGGGGTHARCLVTKQPQSTTRRS